MLSAMDRASELPKDTKIFCGHEYTAKNLEFGIMAEPENKHIETKMKQVNEMLSNKLYKQALEIVALQTGENPL